MLATISALEIGKIQKLQLKAKIEEKKRMLLLKYDFKPKMAPIINPKDVLEQVKQLWQETSPSNMKAVLVRKQAALIYLFTTLSARRWVDVCRLKWTDIQWVVKPHGCFILIRIHISKSNSGEKIEELTMAGQPTNWTCPIKLLARYWMMMNQPQEGFIFPCGKITRIGQCQGHRGRTCLGFETGDVTISALTRYAKKKKWPDVPTKHTGRRTGIAASSLHNIPRERILETTGWTQNSDMLRHYTAATQAVRADGIAQMYANELQQKQPFLKFDNLHI